MSLAEQYSSFLLNREVFGENEALFNELQRLFEEMAALQNHIYTESTKGLVPTGVILAYGAAIAPTGWLLCNSSAISRLTYADLFAIIGTTHGVGDGSTTFNLPGTEGRYITGTPSGGTLGDGAGTALTDAEDRATGLHDHRMTDELQWRGTDTGTVDHQSVGEYVSASNVTNRTEATGSVAGTNAPYIQLHYIIKT